MTRTAIEWPSMGWSMSSQFAERSSTLEGNDFLGSRLLPRTTPVSSSFATAPPGEIPLVCVRWRLSNDSSMLTESGRSPKRSLALAFCN